MKNADLNINKVLVTGSAGTVGNILVENLLKSGYRVRGVDIRPTETHEFTNAPTENLEIVTGDLTNKEFAQSTVQGVDAIINTAAIVDISLSYKELAPLNVMAVRYLYEAAKSNGVKIFVHFSSGSIYGPDSILVTEETPIRPKSPYEQTKAESEDLIRVLGTDNKVPFVILRPGLIYGPRGRFLANGFSAVPAIFKYMMGNKVPRFDGGPKTNLVHAEDVARAAQFLMETPQSWKKEYNIADKTILSFGEIVSTNLKAYGLKLTHTIKFPSPKLTRPLRPFLDNDLFFRIVNIPIDFAWEKLCKEFEIIPHLRPRLDRETAPYMFHNVIFSTERLSRLGFSLLHQDYRKSVPEVMNWYINHRWIPRNEEIQPASGLIPMIGLTFSERMSGTYRLLKQADEKIEKTSIPNNGKEYAIEFEIDALAPRLERFIANPRTKITGYLYIEGMANRHIPIKGTLDIPLLTRKKIAYNFTFKTEDGKTYKFDGEKNIKLLHLIETFTTLPGQITDDEGNEIGSAVLKFNLKKDLIPFLRSFSLTYQ